MARSGTRVTAVRLPVDLLRRRHRRPTRTKVPKVGFAHDLRKIGATGGVHFMIAVVLRVVVHIVSSHNSTSSLASSRYPEVGTDHFQVQLCPCFGSCRLAHAS